MESRPRMQENDIMSFLVLSSLLVTGKNDKEVPKVCTYTSVIPLMMTTAVSYTVE